MDQLWTNQEINMEYFKMLKSYAEGEVNLFKVSLENDINNWN